MLEFGDTAMVCTCRYHHLGCNEPSLAVEFVRRLLRRPNLLGGVVGSTGYLQQQVWP